MSADRAEIYYGDKRAGELRKTGEGFVFVYDAAYLSSAGARPISLSMPLRAQPYESKRLFPFFDGLLPEGWLLDLICASAKIDKNDKFRLLLHTGQDPIGAVSIKVIED